jgi:uncharacterized protein (DUF2164 family)
MTHVKRSWDLLTDEKRKKAIDEIIGFFQSERNETIGVIAAESILDFILQTVSKDIYNKGVDDTYSFLKEHVAGMETDINALVKK